MRRLALTAALVLAAAAPAAAAPRRERLHATRGEDPAIVDAAGRQVLLRGVNVNQLGDYFQANPRFAPVVPLRERDFDQIAVLGFNSVRLLVHWSSLEPQPGAFDGAFVARVRRAVRWARARGLYVVLDMHQDAWGKYIASPPGEACLPGFTPALGWDGAPQWATITDGLPRCKIQLREGSPAQRQAWSSFYVDRDGIQSALVRTWARLAREFAADPTVAGYDLLNEPNPGWAIGADETVPLGRFYTRAIAAIRAAEAGAPGGFRHIVFFEPGALWSTLGTIPTPPASFSSDSNLVFAPHIYADSITATPGLTVEQGFDYAESAARQYGVTVWSGEWGWFGEPASDRAEITRYARQEDEHLYGGAWWQWKQACGDPHNFSVAGGQPTSVSGNLNPYRCPEGRQLPVPPTTRRILGRAMVRAAPGRIARLRSDPDSGDFSVAGSDLSRSGSCRLRAWIPDGRGRPLLAGTGVSDIDLARVPGGWLASACARGAYELRIGGFTRETRGCLARRVRIGPRGIGRVRLGRTRAGLLRRIRRGLVRRTRHRYSWCVKGGPGRVSAVFSSRSARGRARLVVTTARGHRTRGIGRRARLGRVLRRFPRARRIGRRILRASPRSRRLIGLRGRRVRFVAVADRRLIADPRALRRYLRRAGL